jgi:hypothetical protein
MVRLDPLSIDDVAQKDTGWDTKYTLSGIQFPSVFFEGFERLLEVNDEVIGGLRLRNYIVNIGLNVVAYLIFKATLDGSLIRCTSIYESEGYGGVIVGVERCNEGCFDLVLLL